MPPKYSLMEIERRWLVDLTRIDLSSLGEPVNITDRYLIGTQLRLRKMVERGEVTYKFVKKYGREGWAEPITNLYLDEAEYSLLVAVSANEIRKSRYRLDAGSLDIYKVGAKEVGIYEVEFVSIDAARAFVPSEFVIRELIEGEMSGAALALQA